MAINLSDNILAQTTAPLDTKYGPYSGATLTDAKNAALTYLIASYRYEGLTVGLKVGSSDLVEYWFVGGVANGNLVLKTTSGGGTSSGTFSNVYFNSSDTIEFFTQSVSGGLSASASIKSGSVTSDLLSTVNGGATAGYILSNDGSGNFNWVENIGGGFSASFENSDTISFTQNGLTYSASILPSSITASLLNTGLNGGATVGYILSVDVDGNFLWTQSSASGTQIELNNSETITFVTQSITGGLSASAIIATASIKASMLATASNGGATAGYVLSNTGDDNFAWIPQTPFSLSVIDYGTGNTFSGVENITFRGGIVNVPNGTAGGVLAAGTTPNITVWIPAPPPAVYASHFTLNDGNTNGSVGSNLVAYTTRISTPDSEGNPFETGGWAGENRSTTLQRTITISTGGLVTGFSATSSGDSRVKVEVYKANGTDKFEEFTTPVLYQNGVHNNGGAGITVSVTGYQIDDGGFPEIYPAKWKAGISVLVDMGLIFNAYSLDGGRYSVKVYHHTDTATDTGLTYSTTIADVFVDTNPTTPSIGGSTTIVESQTASNIITKHISGVEYYTTGSKFEIVSRQIDNLNKNTQGFNFGTSKNFTITAPKYNLPSYSLQAWSPSVGNFEGWSNIYTLMGVTYSFYDWAISSSSTYRYRGSAAQASAQAFDPWNSGNLSQTATASILIDQVSDNSTRLGESFNGETERLVRGSGTYSTWDSTLTLGSSISNQTGSGTFCDACIVGGRLVRPDNFFLTDPSTSTINPNLTSFKPDKNGTNPDYSGYNQIATYHRRFYTSVDKNFASFIVSFSGSFGTYSNAITALENSALRFYVRKVFSLAPGSSYGPSARPLSLHGGLIDSVVIFNDGIDGVDTPGSWIRTGGSGNTVNASFASFTGKWGFWVEIQIVNPNISLDTINVTLTFADSSTDSAPVT